MATAVIILIGLNKNTGSCMKKIFFSAAVLTGVLSALSAAPEIRNGSFELESDDWTVVRFSRKDQYFRPAQPDPKQRIHGRQSLRIDNPNADSVELSAVRVFLRKGQTYTLSWYARSDRPLHLRGALISQCDDRWYVPAAHTTVTTSWKRFHCTFRVQEDSDFLPRFTWGNWGGKANPATLWIDGVRLDEGVQPSELSQDDSAVDVSATLNDRLSVDKQPLTLTVRAFNHTKKEKRIPLNFTLEDTVFPEYSIELPPKILSVPPGQLVAWKTFIRPTRFGQMKLREKSALFPSLSLAVIPNVPKGHSSLRTAHHTGVEYDFSCREHEQNEIPHTFRLPGSGVEENLAFYRKAGISLLRVGNLGTAFSWKNIETKPGVFEWSEVDRQIRLAEQYGFHLMPVFGNMLYLRDRRGKKRHWSRLPEFVIRNGKRYCNPKQSRWDGVLPSHSDWKRYAAAFGSHCKGKIAAYEITNEPNIVIPAEHYVEYVKIAAGEIRKADPSALIIGGCLTADYDGKLGHYLALLNSSGALAMCDALSFHPYSSRLDTSRTTAQANIHYLREKTHGKTLWNSELYYLWDPPKGSYNNEVVLFSGVRPHHLFRRFTIDFGEGVMQSVPLSVNHLLGVDGDLTNWKGSPVFLTGPLIPNEMYATYAAASALFTGSRGGKKVQTPSFVTCYRFRHRDGGHFAVFWAKGEAKKGKAIFSRNCQVRDLFGNPLSPRKEVVFSEDPLIVDLPEDGSFPIRFE